MPSRVACAAAPPRRLVADLADADSMSAGESLSRVQMFRLGVPRPRLQVPHDDDQGLIGVVDFDWLGVIGEFDGKLKYRVPPGASPEEAAEIVWREKKREDRLRVGSRVARWTWEVALDRDRLGRRTRGAGGATGPSRLVVRPRCTAKRLSTRLGSLLRMCALAPRCALLQGRVVGSNDPSREQGPEPRTSEGPERGAADGGVRGA